MMDTDKFFSKFSEGILAILAGISIIITISFFVYVVGQFLPDKQWLFVFSLIAVIVGVIAPISFYISELTVWPDLLGKLITGITIALLAVLLVNVYLSYEVGELLRVFLSGILGLFSSLLLVRGVLVPLYGSEVEFESSETIEESFEEDFEDQMEEDFSTEEESDFEESSVNESFPDQKEDEEKFPEEENEPW